MPQARGAIFRGGIGSPAGGSGGGAASSNSGHSRARSLVSKFQCSREMVLDVLGEHGWALRFAAPKVQDDREAVLKAVEQFGAALQFASDELRDDPSVVGKAVEQNGLALKYASEKLRGNKELALKAVSRSGPALKYASEALCKDRAWLMDAVTQSEGGNAMHYVPEAVRQDRAFVGECTKINPALKSFVQVAASTPRQTIRGAKVCVPVVFTTAVCCSDAVGGSSSSAGAAAAAAAAAAAGGSAAAAPAAHAYKGSSRGVSVPLDRPSRRQKDAYAWTQDCERAVGKVPKAGAGRSRSALLQCSGRVSKYVPKHGTRTALRAKVQRLRRQPENETADVKANG